jgi:hypothetical protein
MTEEKYIELKDTYLKNIKRYMTEEGGLFSHISVFAEKLECNEDDDETSKNAIIHIPLPEKIANSDEGKEYFVTKMLPEIASSLKESFVTTGVAWASEAWLRSSHIDDKQPENWKDMPIKKEVLMISMESAFGNETSVYEIVRSGMKVTEEGLSDTIELIKDEELSGENLNFEGRFTGLYKKFI